MIPLSWCINFVISPNQQDQWLWNPLVLGVKTNYCSIKLIFLGSLSLLQKVKLSNTDGIAFLSTDKQTGWHWTVVSINRRVSNSPLTGIFSCNLVFCTWVLEHWTSIVILFCLTVLFLARIKDWMVYLCHISCNESWIDRDGSQPGLWYHQNVEQNWRKKKLNILTRLGTMVLVPLWASNTAKSIYCGVMSYIASWNKA